MKIIYLEETESTNTYVTSRPEEFESWTIVAARRQTGGRGQRGNSWESEAGLNLTFSVAIRPEGFRARDQFSISEAVALAVVDTLACESIDARVKWPNDIYVGDKKICGILIEHSVTGMNITSTTAGVGLNVNQIEFRSDAPNPTSMAKIAEREFNLEELLEKLGEKIQRYCEKAFSQEGRKFLHNLFKRSLWRGDGRFYSFSLPEGEKFEARIVDIEPGGMLVLERRSGDISRFAFKEVIFNLGPNPGEESSASDNITGGTGVK